MAKVAQWAVTLGLLAGLLLVVDVGDAFSVLRSADPVFLGLALLAALTDRLMMAGKWLPLLWVQLPDIPAWRAVRAYFAANFSALLLPASVGADVLRAIGLGRSEEAVVEVGASVAVERVLGLTGSGVAGAVALSVALAVEIETGFLLPWAMVCTGFGIVAILIPYSGTFRGRAASLLDRFEGSRVAELIGRFGASYGLYRGNGKILFVVGVLSVMEQFVPVLVFWMAAHALSLNVTFEALLVAVPLTVFATRLPISIAGIGILEGGLVYLLGLFGVPSHQGLSLALVGRVVEWLAILPGAFWWRELTGGKAMSLRSSTFDSEEANTPLA